MHLIHALWYGPLHVKHVCGVFQFGEIETRACLLQEKNGKSV